MHVPQMNRSAFVATSTSVGRVPLDVENPGRSFRRSTLLDDLIRTQQQRGWDRKAERFGRLHVHDELELVGLLKR